MKFQDPRPSHAHAHKGRGWEKHGAFLGPYTFVISILRSPIILQMKSKRPIFGHHVLGRVFSPLCGSLAPPRSGRNACSCRATWPERNPATAAAEAGRMQSRTTSHFCRKTCMLATREDTPSTYTAIGKVTMWLCVSPGKLPFLMRSPLTQHSWGQSRMVRTQSNGAQLYWLETRLSCTSGYGCTSNCHL